MHTPSDQARALGRDGVPRRCGAVACAVVVLLVGTALSLATAAGTGALERRAAQVELDHRAAVAGWALALEARRYADATTALAAAASAQQDFTAADFATMTRPLTRSPLAGVAGVSFVAAATDPQVAATSAYWQARGASRLRPNASVSAHLFAVYTASIGAPGPPSGTDLATVPGPERALQRARATGGTTVSDAFVLPGDRRLPPAEQQPSFLMAAPVSTPAVAGRPGGHRPLRGWVVLSARARDLATGTLSDVGQGLLDVELAVPDPAGRPVPVVSVRTGRPASTTTARRVPVAVAGQSWTLTVQSTEQAERLRGGYVRLGRVLGYGGTVLSLLLALLVWSLLSARARARAQVRTATAGLRQAEGDARAQAALLDAVVGSIGDGVVVVDRNGRSLLHNPAARDLLGLGAAELDEPSRRAEHYRLFLPDGTTPFPHEQLPLVRGLAGEPTDDVDMVLRRAGLPEPVVVSVTSRPLDGFATVGGGAVAVFHDVTQARALQRRLAEQSEAQERLLEALSELGEGVCVTEQGRLVHVNDAYARLTGYSARELLDLDVQLLPADAEAAADFAAFAARLPAPGRTASSMTTRLRHRDGHVVPVEATGISLDADGVLQRVSLVRDLSGPLAAAAELASRAEQLEAANLELAAARDAATAASTAKSAFVARMSHEIRTPLHGVLGLTTLLAGTGLTPGQRHLADTAAQSGQALLRIVDDVLDFSRIEAGQLRLERVPVDVQALLESTVALFAESAAAGGLELSVRCPPLPPVRTDPTRLRQILTNLVGNAVKFTADGSVTVACRLAGPSLQLTVSDTGPGIRPEAQSRLFAAFEQADSSTTRTHGGTGLGLTISSELAGLLAGSLTCTSTPGSGSTFALTLPLESPAPAAVPDVPGIPLPRPAPPPATAPAAPLRVLVADDNAVNQLVASMMVEQLGHLCDVVDDGQQAVDAARATRYDVVLMDCQMPVLDGLDATRLLRADPATRDLPVVALTAGATTDERDACLREGMTAWLSKPVRLEDLRDMLDGVCAAAQVRAT